MKQKVYNKTDKTTMTVIKWYNCQIPGSKRRQFTIIVINYTLFIYIYNMC